MANDGNIITSANDVDMIVSPVNGGSETGTTGDITRIVVDEFSLTREDGSELVGTVGDDQPAGIHNGDVTYSFSFSLMGQYTDLWRNLHDSEGSGKFFEFTVRKINEDGNLEFEKSLSLAKATSEEDTASTGDPYEYAVEGIGMGYSDEF
jgi:hypothetical protein